ncbi:hypothetical protein ACVWY3_003073 [Bradyrhizobium sp. USDA 4486]
MSTSFRIEDRVVAHRPRNSCRGHLTVHGLDDVAAFPHASELGLELRVDPPAPRLCLVRQPHPLQRSQPSDPRHLPGGLPSRQRTQLEYSVPGISQDAPVKPRKPLGCDLLLKLSSNLDVRFRAELSRDELCCPRPKAMSDIVARDDEVLSFVILAAQNDVRMGMAGVEMIGSNPVEPGAEIPLHLPHEVADEGFQVRQLSAVLWRHDKPELVAVAGAAFRKVLAIGAVTAGIVKLPWLTLPRNAVALDVSEVSSHGTSLT